MDYQEAGIMNRLSAPTITMGICLAVSSLAAGAQSAGNAAEPTLTEQLSLHSQGVNLELGRGVAQDYAKAAEWYRKGAEIGHADSQNDLAKLYEDGRGVPQDDRRAYYWYTRAAEGGNACAASSRKKLLERMSPDDLSETRELQEERGAGRHRTLLSRL
jgi:TPR repeat protein